MKESLRYLKNAKEILAKAPVEGKSYADVKYVQEACSTAYLAVLKAIDEYLLSRGLGEKELPESVDEYRKALRKHGAIHDGKLMREFEYLYDELHIAGYYRGRLHRVSTVKGAFNGAKEFIEKLQ
ncbi:MAG: DUF5618 family protein [Thermodesulfobacteriota bacterium]